MKNTRIFIVFLVMLVFAARIFAIPPQQRQVGNTLVKAGISTKKIMPLLVTIASKYGKYLRSVQGKYTSCYIDIDLEPNSNICNVDEMERVTKRVVDNVMSFYPSCKGEVALTASSSDRFHFIFENGRITEDKSIRSKEK